MSAALTNSKEMEAQTGPGTADRSHGWRERRRGSCVPSLPPQPQLSPLHGPPLPVPVPSLCPAGSPIAAAGARGQAESLAASQKRWPEGLVCIHAAPGDRGSAVWRVCIFSFYRKHRPQEDSPSVHVGEPCLGGWMTLRACLAPGPLSSRSYSLSR